jgi:prevent-host-death family protein
MSSVGIKELKNRLTTYIRMAKEGKEVVVTERGRPVVLIRSLRNAADVTSLEAKLARLADRGIATPPERRSAPKIQPVRAPGMPASRIIIEERR